MLRLVETEQLDNAIVTRYDCNETVKCNGTSIWGNTKGRTVHVTHIDVIEETDINCKTVNVTHDSTWDIYTDTAFTKAISEAMKMDIDFTEQGMQDDGLASMEVYS